MTWLRSALALWAVAIVASLIGLGVLALNDHMPWHVPPPSQGGGWPSFCGLTPNIRTPLQESECVRLGYPVN
jgi:hypothetical protein